MRHQSLPEPRRLPRFRPPFLRAPKARGLALVLLGLAWLPTGCASSGGSRSSDDGPRVLVTMRDYATGRVFELASESHTDRVAYYSKERGDAARKIQTDEVMELLVSELASSGYDDFAQTGRAPSGAGGVVRRGFEIEDGEETTHWLVGAGSPIEERKAFNECLEQFLGLYNISASYQTVENQEGHEFFEPGSRAAAAPKR